jgi:hypothetical protein
MTAHGANETHSAMAPHSAFRANGAVRANSAIRASDSDRENVVTILRDAYTVGRLTLEEFDERTTAALSGRTWGVLAELTKDLPQDAKLGADLRQVGLPGTDDSAAQAMDPGVRMWRIVPLLPIAAVWLIVALSARMPDSVVPVIIALLLLLRCTVSHRPVRREAARSQPGDRSPRSAPGRERRVPR